MQRYALSLLLSAWVTAVSAAQTEISPLVAGQTLAQVGLGTAHTLSTLSVALIPAVSPESTFEGVLTFWVHCTTDAQDQNLCSPEGTVCLVAQGDGNLVLCALPNNCRAFTYFSYAYTCNVHVVHLVCLDDECTSCRYNETLVAMMGPSALSAIYATGTYTASANGHPAPYTLSMQRVHARLPTLDLHLPSSTS